MKNDKPKKSFNDELENLLKTDSRFVDEEGNLIKSAVIDKAWKFDEDLINLLFFSKTKEVKGKFFKQIKESWIFNVVLFIDFVQDKHFLSDSHTKFGNKIGLTLGGKHLKQNSDVALVWPFKDCVLEGGMSDENAKRKEIFFNEILAQDEIDRLLHPKVLTKGKRFSHGKKQSGNKLKLMRDKSGLIRDNLIIKGNNLLAMYSLREEFAGKIKLIYIDPPYNTGNDSFKYNDNFSHSTWLTFMKNRLEVARELLCNDGVIFVQCDDNEQAYLKVLMDEVFGRDNFVSSVVWQRSYSPINLKNHFSDNHDTIHCYTKNLSQLHNFTLTRDEEAVSRYKNPDNDHRGNWKQSDLSVGPAIEKNIYPIKTPSGKEVLPPKGRSWVFSKERMHDLLLENRIYFPQGGRSVPSYKRFLSDVKDGVVPMSLWTYKEVGHTQDAKRELKTLFDGESLFDSPKPEKLIQRIIELATSEGDIILDYHLGSGTTAAVAHKVGRQYIGIEQMDYIKTVTVKRLEKVLAGEQGGISKLMNWKGGGEFVYLELKRYNEEFIDRIQSAKTPETLKEIWEEMKDKSFLNWNADFKNENSAFKEWAEMSIEGKQKALISLLDKNQLYVNLSEIEDEDFDCTDDEKELSKQFYGKSNR